MNLARHYAAAFLITLVAACASVPSPDTFNQKLAVAIVSVTAVRNTTTTLLQSRKITAEDAENVQATANTARSGIEVARTLSKINIAQADGKLSAVTTTLQALQTYLGSKQ